ncbi:hypothetical protein ACI6PS_03585 [Flavobacterium sp. PLA-1-15]|uniref:hypothetical protein n=1 Tax=Flavobacterium sp. PLA-1-15 TaxID=3380533 RepID=UPI003B785739
MNKGKNIPAVKASSPPGMGNPAVIAVASVIPWGFLIKTGVLLGLGYYVLNSFKKRFVKKSEVERYGPASISDGEAKSKADAIHTAMLGFGNGFEIVRENIAGLNYNGWVKLYNAFGNREDSIPGNDDMNLVEWFMDQFDTQELNELRVILPGVF